MTREATPDLDGIEKTLLGSDHDARRRAMQDLLLRARNDPATHPAILQLLRRLLEAQELQGGSDIWVASSAIQGIAEIAGPEEGRRTLLAVLTQGPRHVAAGVALSVRDTSNVPVLIEALSLRPESEFRIPVIRALGRLRGDAVFPALLPYLGQAVLRPHVIEALGDLRDPRAVPNLERALHDRTPAWPIDNHGPMLYVADLAQSALEAIRAQAAAPARPEATPLTRQPAAPVRSRVSDQAVTAAAIAAIGVAFIGFLQYAAIGRIGGLMVLVELAMAVLCVRLAKGRRPSERFCLFLGGIGCAAVVLGFVWQLFD